MTDTAKPNADRDCLFDCAALDRNDSAHRWGQLAARPVRKAARPPEGLMTAKHPNWRCPGCGEVMYYRGACHHAYGCDDHPGCEKYREAKYRASGMWPVNWSRERIQQASGKTPERDT
jgi:hypothetical protein